MGLGLYINWIHFNYFTLPPARIILKSFVLSNLPWLILHPATGIFLFFSVTKNSLSTTPRPIWSSTSTGVSLLLSSDFKSSMKAYMTLNSLTGTLRKVAARRTVSGKSALKLYTTPPNSWASFRSVSVTEPTPACKMSWNFKINLDYFLFGVIIKDTVTISMLDTQNMN